jgi:hypothetical protein
MSLFNTRYPLHNYRTSYESSVFAKEVAPTPQAKAMGLNHR